MINQKITRVLCYKAALLLLLLSLMTAFCACGINTSSDYDIIEVSRFLDSTIGMEADEAESSVEKYFDLDLVTENKEICGGKNEYTYSYSISDKLSVAGVLIDRIELTCDEKTNNLVRISLVRDNCTLKEAEKYYNDYYESLSAVYTFKGGVSNGDTPNQETTNLTGVYEIQENWILVGYSQNTEAVSFVIECVSD